MTDLLTRSRPRSASEAPPPRRSPALGAALAGLTASGSVLLGCLAVALVGWYAADAGGHGDTRDALRVGADAWLLAHGGGLGLPSAAVTVVPLGLTLLCALVAYRRGRRTGARAEVPDTWTALTATAVLAGVYAVVALVVAILASTEQAEVHPLRAFLGGLLVAGVGGGAGLTRGSGLWSAWRARTPAPVRAVAAGAFAVVLVVLAVASALLAVALLLDLGAAANVLARLHTGAAGGLLYTLVVASVTPNAVLLGGAYLVGPGFAVGAGTVVSPSTVVLGPLPAFPLVAALPGPGPAPWWTQALMVVPVLAGCAAAGRALWRHPAGSVLSGAALGLLAGLGGGLLLSGAVALAGGAVGPGRMAEVGAFGVQVLLTAVPATTLGGLVGGVVATWWRRRACSARAG